MNFFYLTLTGFKKLNNNLFDAYVKVQSRTGFTDINFLFDGSIENFKDILFKKINESNVGVIIYWFSFFYYGHLSARSFFYLQV